MHSSSSDWSLPILSAKLHWPIVRVASIKREQLYKQLDKGIQYKLTTIVAPAGFGKSTLLSQWSEQQQIPVAWLSLEAEEDSFTGFITYLCAAIRKARPELSLELNNVLQKALQFPSEFILRLLINTLEAHKKQWVLILDDYHVIHENSIHHALLYLVRFMPEEMHLIIASRHQLPFVNENLLIKEDILQLSGCDLLLTTDEIFSYAQLFDGVTLTVEEATLLHKQTEGWIAGLKLFLLRAQKHKRAKAVESIAMMETKELFHYLSEQVFVDQTPEVQQFLLHTSVAKRLNAPLCSKLLDDNVESKEMLSYLERVGLFLIPLDAENGWYRYHHLFAKFLHDRLLRTSPQGLRRLQRVAAEWYFEHGFTADAIEHALQATDFAYAITMMKRELTAILDQKKWGHLLQWMKQIPEEQLITEPDLAAIAVSLFIYYDERIQAVALLDKLEIFIERQGEQCFLNMDNSARSTFDFIKIYMDYVIREPGKDADHGEADIKRLIEAIPFKSIPLTGTRINSNKESLLGNPLASRGMNRSMKLHEQLLRYWNLSEEKFHYIYSLILVGECYYERNELVAAELKLREALPLCMKTADIGLLIPALMTSTKIRMAHDNLTGAAAYIDHAYDIVNQYAAYQYSPVIYAVSVRLAIRKGDEDTVVRWLEEYIQQHNEVQLLSSRHEFEHMTFLRALIFLKREKEIFRYCGQFRQMAEKNESMLTIIEQGILIVLVHHMNGQVYDGFRVLEEYLELAAEQQYISIFLNEGEAMRKVLFGYVQSAREGIIPVTSEAALLFAQKLLALLNDRLRRNESTLLHQEKIEHLTKQEKRILEYLSKGLSRKEIATELSITYETVKMHCKRIYKKLNVNNQVQAINKYIGYF